MSKPIPHKPPRFVRPDDVVEPGEVLRETLEGFGWKQRELALATGLSAGFIRKLLNGQERITPEVATALADAMGCSANLWINLEQQYQATKSAMPS